MKRSIAVALLVPAAGLAQEAADVRAPGVVVTATRLPQQDVDIPGAVDRVDARRIREGNPQVNLSEALGAVPGVVVQNRQNHAQDLQISVRGFGARSTFGVRGVRLLADGIPATMPDGQGQAASFSLSSAHRIEVLRGPLASLYGNASGGVLQVFTADGPPEPELAATVFLGSDRMRKAGLQLGGEAGGLNYRVDASRFRTAGYRDHSAARRDHVHAKLGWPVGTGRLTVVANVLEQPGTQDPLGLTRAQFETNPRQADPAATAFDTRKSVRQAQAGTVFEGGFRGLSLLAKAYAGDRQVVQYLSQEGSGPLASGGVVDLDRAYGGAGLRVSRAFPGTRATVVLTAGVDADRMKERRRGFVNEAGVAGALRRDEDDRVGNTDVYVQTQVWLSPRWIATAGARHSRVRFASRDDFVTALNPDDSGSVRYERTSPVAGIVFRALPGWSLYANAGAGFETPTFAELAYRPGGAPGLNFALQPAKSRHAEAGAKARLGERLRLDAAVFRIDTRDEIVTAGSSGGRTTFRNASRTRREGIELALAARLPAGLDAQLAWTGLDARFAGQRLPGVARSAFQGELRWSHAPLGFHAALQVRSVSRIFVDDANSDAAPAYAVADLRAGFEQRVAGWRLAQFARVDNVADRRYAGSVIVAEARGRFFEPAPGRAFLLGLEARRTF